MSKFHEVTGLRFEDDFMVLIVDGELRRFNLREASRVLLAASEQERMTYEISPSGYGIHWPLLDEDLSIDGLLGITHRPKRPEKTVP